MSKKSRNLSIPEMVGFGVGNCVGSGIFVYMGLAIGFTGRSVNLALIVASIAMFFAYIYKTLIVSMLPLSGGTYAQSAILQPKWLAGMSAIITIIRSMATSGFAIAIVQYASIPFPQIAPYGKIIAFALVTLFFASTFKGAKFMAKMNIIMVAVMVISLLSFVVAGIPQVRPGIFAFSSDEYFTGGPVGFLCAVAVMGIACQGSTYLIAFASETKKPTRSIPIAIMLTTLIVGLLYFVIATVAGGVLPVEQVANQSLAVVAQQVFPYPVYLVFVLGGACFAIATTLYGTIASLKYPILSSVEDGWLPPVVGKCTSDGYPWVIMLITYLVGIIPILTGMDLDQIASYLMIPTMFLNILNNILFYRLTKKYPNAWKRSFFHMPNFCLILVITIAVLADLLVCVAMFTTVGEADKYVIPLMLIAIYLYSIWRIKSGKVTMKSVEEARRQAEAEAQELDHE